MTRSALLTALMFLHQVSDLMMELTDDDRADRFISHALAVRQAEALGDYVAFFRLHSSAPGHSQYVMDTFTEAQRYEAVRLICRAYQPTVPVSFIASNLRFASADDAAFFLTDHGAVLAEEGFAVDCKASKKHLVEGSISQKLEEQRKEAQRKAEIVPISFTTSG